MEISVREISVNDDQEYNQLLHFRHEWLRKPLGLDLFKEDLSDDLKDIILAAFEEENMVGCVMLHPIEKDRVKLRQMATHPSVRGKGVGSMLVIYAEELMKRKSRREIILHARATAVGFYEKLGYHTFGEPFTEVTIPHIAMKKDLD